MTTTRSALYPQIHVEVGPLTIALYTTLRKEHEGKWYLWRFIKTCPVRIGHEKLIRDLSDKLHVEVYNSIVLGKISTELKYAENNKPVFELDPIQESETERLTKLMFV
jgi:hypothetical protein